MAKVVIAELDIDIAALLKTTSDLKKEIDALKNTQKDLAASGQSTSEAFIQNEAVLKTLNSAYASNVKAVAESGKATATQADQSELLSLALSQEATSIAEAREQNKLLNKLRNETNATTADGQAQITALNAKLDENNAFIKANGDQYLQQKLNIGNYKESIKEAFQEMNIFNGGLGGFIQRSQEAGGVGNLLSNSLGGITQGVIGMTRASLAFIATPIGAVIAAIGLVVGALVNYLKSSQEGIDAVTSVTRPLQAIFQSLMGVIQNVGKYLFEAFSNPKKTLTELYDFVKQNLINRFTAFGKILEGIIELDFKKVTNGVLQAGTGVENLTDKIQNGAKATGKFLDDAIKKGQQIDALKKQIERGELAYQRAQIKTNDLIDQQLLISKDTSRTFAERGAAANEIIRLTTELSKKEEEIIQKKIKALKLEYSMKDAKAITIAEQQKLIDLEKSLDEAQDRGLNARLEQTRVLSGLRKEQQAQAEEAQAKELERQNKAIEAQLSKSKQEIELFKAQQGFKAKSTEEQYAFSKQLYDKELADLNLNYQKGKISKLEYETAKLNLSNDYAQKNADILIEEGQREVERIKANSKLSIDEKLKAEMDFAALRLQQGLINEQQYQDEITKLQNDAELQRQNKKLADEQLEKERKLVDLENERATGQLNFEQDVEIQKQQNDIKLQEELAAAEKSGADQNLIKAKYAKINKDLDQSVEAAKIQGAINTFGQIAQLLGEQSAIGKAFALSQTILSGIQGVQNAYTTAQKSPITLGFPAYPIVQAGLAGAFSAIQVAKIGGVKFEKGGIQEIGGKRHSAGGTKFWGEDGTMFEAEAGEGIGILNRNAFASFMDFNNAHLGGRSTGGFFAGGGIITQGVRPETLNIDSVVDAIASMPAPVVAVEEIQTVGNRYTNVVSGANL
jgi:hypothetical protein